MLGPAEPNDPLSTGMKVALSAVAFGEVMTSGASKPPEGMTLADAFEQYVDEVSAELSTHPSALLEAQSYVRHMMKEAPTAERSVAMLALDKIEAKLNRDGQFDNLILAELDRHLDGMTS